MEQLGSAFQKSLWDQQHVIRGGENGEFGSFLKFVPNNTAVIFNRYLSPNSTILEIGAANGRDARYWAAEGHNVFALDFSTAAITQLTKIAKEQSVLHRIIPMVWDISTGHLPDIEDISIDGFYARSALHVDDATMLNIAKEIDQSLKPNGVILIEGKGPNDKKIMRSTLVEGNLAIDLDNDGHLRRIWTREFVEKMCSDFNWSIENIMDVEEVWQGIPATFMRLIAKKKDNINKWTNQG